MIRSMILVVGLIVLNPMVAAATSSEYSGRSWTRDHQSFAVSMTHGDGHGNRGCGRALGSAEGSNSCARMSVFGPHVSRGSDSTRAARIARILEMLEQREYRYSERPSFRGFEDWKRRMVRDYSSQGDWKPVGTDHDDVSAPVPEPSAALLFGIGSLVAGRGLRRKP
jgi:PEP-CTERM motif